MHVAVQDVYTYIYTCNYYQDRIKCAKSKHEFKAEMVIPTVLCLYQFSICISNILSCPGNTHVHIIHTHTHTDIHTYIHVTTHIHAHLCLCFSCFSYVGEGSNNDLSPELLVSREGFPTYFF